jgi:hypothetical protein
LGVLPEEDCDLEQVCELDGNREHDDDDDDYDFGTTSHREFLILMLSALQLLELGWVHSYNSLDSSAQQVLQSMALVHEVAFFWFASILYKLSLGFRPAVLVPKEGWLGNTVFAVILSVLIFKTGWTYYWLYNDVVLQGAFLFLAIAAVLYQLSLKKNPVALVPEIWMCAALATALLGKFEIVPIILMVGGFVLSLATVSFACTVSR